MVKICIIGCGHGGQALAAHLTLAGHQITLYAHPHHANDLNQIKENNNSIKLFGAFQTKQQIHLLTTDIQLALNDKAIIYISLPTFAHETIFRNMLPYLRQGQIIVTLASNFSSLAYLELQRKTNIRTKLIFVDICSLPYACRAEQPGHINIYAMKQQMSAAVLPSYKTTKIMSLLIPAFPTQLIAKQNTLALGLNISSGITHPTIALLNAGRIGLNKQPFYFYKEGISTEIATLLEKIDHDRCEIGQRFGYHMTTYLDIMNNYYGIPFNSIYDFFTQTKVHNSALLCPDSLQSRYITQDIPYILVPWFNLGLLVNYCSESIRAVIQLASQLLQQDFMTKGRHLETMGLQDKNPEQIHALLTQDLLPDSNSNPPLQEVI